MGFFLIIIIIAIVYGYYRIMFGSPNAKYLRRLKKGKTDEQKRVIDYFVRSSKLGRMIAKTMTDNEYSDLVRAKADSLNLRQKAIEQTGLDEDEINEIKPIPLVGYNYENSWGHQQENQNWVSTSYEVTWIFFSESQVHLFFYKFDTDQDKHDMQTQEYFYQDITSFSTKLSSQTIKTMSDGVEKEQTVDTTMFELVVPGDKMLISMNGSEKDEANQSIQAMKQMLREKKNA